MRAIPEGVADTTRTHPARERRRRAPASSAQTGSDDAWGKTGTTDNNGDAWFCGGTDHFTACVWVGHAQTNTPMETEYDGGPVDGGTFPALIWSQVMQAVEEIFAQNARKTARTTARTTTIDEQLVLGSERLRPATRAAAPPRPPAAAAVAAAAAAAAARSSAPAPAPRRRRRPTGGTGGTGL